MGNKRTGRGVEEDAEVLSTDGAKLLSESRPAPGSGVPFEAAAEGTNEPGLPVRYESSCLEGGPRSTLNSRGAKQEDSGMGRGAKGEDADDDNDDDDYDDDDDDDDEGVCVIIYSV